MAITSLVLKRRYLETSILDFMESSGNMKHKNLFEIVLGSQEAKFSNECSRSVRAKCAALQCKGKQGFRISFGEFLYDFKDGRFKKKHVFGLIIKTPSMDVFVSRLRSLRETMNTGRLKMAVCHRRLTWEIHILVISICRLLSWKKGPQNISQANVSKIWDEFII